MNKIEINIPEGFEIDNEKSDFSKGIIEFKPVEKKKLGYENIAKNLFINKPIYFIEYNGIIDYISYGAEYQCKYPNNATSKKQLECLMAYNKLRNVAEYLNAGNKLDWNDPMKAKWFIYYNWDNKILTVDAHFRYQRSDVYFYLKDSAKDAIKILGEEEIKKALFIY